MSRYIDADNLHNAKFQDTSGYGENVAYRVGWNDAIDAICENEPSIEAVRCRECKYYDDEDYGEPTRYCTWHESVVKADGFCSYGEREGE